MECEYPDCLHSLWEDMGLIWVFGLSTQPGERHGFSRPSAICAQFTNLRLRETQHLLAAGAKPVLQPKGDTPQHAVWHTVLPTPFASLRIPWRGSESGKLHWYAGCWSQTQCWQPCKSRNYQIALKYLIKTTMKCTWDKSWCLFPESSRSVYF